MGKTSIDLDPFLKDSLKKLCRKTGKNQSEVIRSLIKGAVDRDSQEFLQGKKREYEGKLEELEIEKMEKKKELDSIQEMIQEYEERIEELDNRIDGSVSRLPSSDSSSPNNEKSGYVDQDGNRVEKI